MCGLFDQDRKISPLNNRNIQMIKFVKIPIVRWRRSIIIETSIVKNPKEFNMGIGYLLIMAEFVSI